MSWKKRAWRNVPGRRHAVVENSRGRGADGLAAACNSVRRMKAKSTKTQCHSVVHDGFIRSLAIRPRGCGWKPIHAFVLGVIAILGAVVLDIFGWLNGKKISQAPRINLRGKWNDLAIR